MSADDPLGLGALTDDQLVEMARHVAVELGRRHHDVQAAAQAAILSEAEKARIAEKAAKAEARRFREEQAERIAKEAVRQARDAEAQKDIEKTARSWSINKMLALMVVETLGKGWRIAVWNRDGDDKRVYLNGPQVPDERDRMQSQEITFFATGNSRNPPGTLDMPRTPPEKREAVRVICREAARRWKRQQEFGCDQTSLAEVEPAPYPDEYIAMRERTDV